MTQESPVAIGSTIAGKYRVERVLGQGGMGVVVAAMHVELDQRVAIKFLLPDALRDAEWVSRFAREAQAAARIQSEHVARVFDVGTLDTGAPYMVMEYLEGRDLQRSSTSDGRCRRPRRSTTCSRRARRSPRRTRSASCTAISSRRTCSSRTAPTARRASRCSTSASRSSRR